MGYDGPTITEIEDAIIAKLAADPALSAYVKTVDRLPWDRLEELEKLVKNYPALLVAYAGGPDESGTTAVLDHAGRFMVWCAAKNLRSPSAAAAGGTSSEKGVYDLLDDVLNCLHFREDNLGVEGVIYVRSVRVVPLTSGKRATIFSREFEVKWRLRYVQ